MPRIRVAPPSRTALTPRSARLRTVAALIAGTAAALVFSAPGHADNSAGTVLGNWFVKAGTTLTPTPISDGSWAYKITNTGRTPVTAVLNDRANSFVTAPAASYIVDAWVRTDDPDISVGLREMEYRGSSKLGEAQSTVWLRDTGWHHLVTRYTGTSAGATIDVNVLGWSLGANKSVLVAHIVRSALGSDSSGAVVTLPDTVPTPTPTPTATPTTVTSSAPTTPAPSSSSATTDGPTSDTPTSDAPTSDAPTSPSTTPVTTPVTTPTPTASSSAPASDDSAPDGYHLVWSDEFTGTSLNTSAWNALNYSTYGDGNGELACLMSRNAVVSGGALHLTANREDPALKCGNDSRFPDGRSYSSEMVTTQNKEAFKYGYFVIRAKLPTEQAGSKGFWPAFWLRPVNGGNGELDVLEAVGSDSLSATNSQVSQTIWYDYNGTYPKQAVAARLGPTPDGYHTFAIKWAPGLLQWSIDGQVTFTRTAATTPWLDSAFNQPFFFRLNLSVGGSWPGAPSASTIFPSSYDIDYIRVYQQ